MSEQAPQMPEALNQYRALEAQVTSNGANRVYGIDEAGKKDLLKGDDVLAAYEYGSLADEMVKKAEKDAEALENSQPANAKGDFEDLIDPLTSEDWFDPEKRAEKEARRADVDKYLARNDQKNSKASGEPDDYDKDSTEAYYGKMTTHELVSKYIDAKTHNDETTLDDILDEVNTRSKQKLASVAGRAETEPKYGNSEKGDDLPFDDKNGHKAADSYIDGFFDQVERREAKKRDSQEGRANAEKNVAGAERELTDESEYAEREKELSQNITNAINRRAARRAGLMEFNGDEDLKDMQEIVDALKEFYGTDDLNDPRIKRDIEAIDEDTRRKSGKLLEKTKKKQGGLRPVRVGEFDEGKENPPAGVMAIEPWTIDDYGKKSEDDSNPLPPPIKFEPPVEQDPPVDPEPPVDPVPTRPIPVAPPHTPENVRRPEKKKWPRRLLGSALGALMLVGLAGPEDGGHNTWNFKVPGTSKTVHWSGVYDIDTAGGSSGWKSNHRGNIPEVRKVDESDNAFGKKGVSDETREEIVGNYDKAEQFFENISTKKGAKNFEKMQKRFDKEVKHYMVSDKMSKSDAEALVRAEMEGYFAHLDAQAARK